MKKNIDFSSNHKLISEYAEVNCEGNFSLAVRQLIKLGLEYYDKKEEIAFREIVVESVKSGSDNLEDFLNKI